MKVLKSHEMAEIDRKTIEEVGIPSPVLMENAARGVLEAIEERFARPKRVLVVAGKGNNGGDGIALARMLRLRGVEADLFLPLGKPHRDGELQLGIYRNMGFAPLNSEPDYGKYDLIVDALFGTGFTPPLRGKASEIVVKINASGVPVVAVDLPSGLSADSGKVDGPCVKAVLSVTFQFPKVCHVLFPAAKFCGEVVVKDISIPKSLARGIKRELLSEGSLKIPKREPDTYKNREGHVLILGGSEGKTGAPCMAAMAATRAGSGLVTVGVPESLNPIFETNLIEEMSLPLPGTQRLSFFGVDEILSEEERFSALAVGMGMDRYEEGQDIVLTLLERWKKPLLIDADGINNLADSGRLELLKERDMPAVLTPHVGEFSRFTGLSSEDIVSNQIDVAQEFSRKYRCYLVLKSARTVISTPEGRAYISMRGTPAMAKGGVGDVLSGILISLMGRMEIEEALKLGVFLHGLAGEIAEKRLHRESLRARDLIDSIPEAYRRIEKFIEGDDTI